MVDLYVQIANIEHWLREKTSVSQAEKSEMISRLCELNDKLNKLPEGLKLLHKGESPIKAQQNEIRSKK